MNETTPKTALSFVDNQLTAYCEAVTSDEPQICQAIREHAKGHPKFHWTSGPLVGTLLKILVSLMQARRVLDIGTFLGYSAAYMASAHRDVKVISLECDPETASKAKEIISTYESGTQIQIVNAEAKAWLAANTEFDFDLIFFDSNRSDLTLIQDHLLKAVRPGGVIVMDNACLRGKVLSPQKLWEHETAKFNRSIQLNESFLTTLLPVRDGVLIAHKL